MTVAKADRVLDNILDHLRALVACDSQNPPRAFTVDASMFTHITQVLGGDFEISVSDHGKGRISLLAVRGRPRLLFNCHLDTVPAGAGWTRPPLAVTVEGKRIHGRGVCDIKGAAACLLEVARLTDQPMALLFTTDEEGAEGCCVAEFVRSPAARTFGQVVVCEPTGCRAVLEHRGYLSVRGYFEGTAGHSSEFRALDDNAIHRFGRWLSPVLALCASEARDGRHPCFNLGTVSGGIKSNVIADTVDVHWSARLPPGGDNPAFLERVTAMDGGHAEWVVPFSGPALPAVGEDSGRAREFARERGLDIRPAVDFWTEASLFSAAGLPALVLGPGDIAQAHTADEWVETDQLRRAADIYHYLVTGHG